MNKLTYYHLKPGAVCKLNQLKFALEGHVEVKVLWELKQILRVGKIERFFVGFSSHLSFLPFEFLKCLLHTLVFALIGKFFLPIR